MARSNPAPAEETPTETQQAAETGVKVVLSHFHDYDGKSYKPGDKLTVPVDVAQSWVWAGYARLEEPDSDTRP
ncbi:DUF7210 family protein [Micromonospora aurantiaca (nom. illeg.)]|uniref:DUF7210 family protein n=1 Tax=Micromonospora aurantiaca (nom. illeg.) TaxID=47850 RepID=UPI0011A699D7|nr:hypothetical protein [Micromonospora aurantiaca]MBC9000504.1 hypothetical protein [Micromonospora aurantiaca]